MRDSAEQSIREVIGAGFAVIGDRFGGWYGSNMIGIGRAALKELYEAMGNLDAARSLSALSVTDDSPTDDRSGRLRSGRL